MVMTGNCHALIQAARHAILRSMIDPITQPCNTDIVAKTVTCKMKPTLKRRSMHRADALAFPISTLSSTTCYLNRDHENDP
jgi:hypothetical protein